MSTAPHRGGGALQDNEKNMHSCFACDLIGKLHVNWRLQDGTVGSLEQLCSTYAGT